MIDRINIQNYRGINDLLIDDLKQINIFVGRNGSGKTSVLEAFSLAARPLARQHVSLASFRGFTPHECDSADMLGSIFNLRNPNMPVHLDVTYSIPQLTELNDALNLEFKIQPLYDSDIETDTIDILSESSEQYFDNGANVDRVLGIQQEITSNGEIKVSQRLLPKNEGYDVSGSTEKIDYLNCFFIEPRRSMSVRETARLLGEQFRTIAWKEKFLSQVQSIFPMVKDVQPLYSGVYINIGANQLLPLPMMGDGFNRIFLMIVGITASPAKTLMIDEIDSGLHYSIMDEFWSALGTIANQGKQIFCTTHNEEMLDSLLDAFGPESELFQIYRIDRDENGDTSCTVYSPRQFENALGFGFDVR